MPPLRTAAPALLPDIAGDPAPDLVGDPLSSGPLDPAVKPVAGVGGPFALDKGPILVRRGASP